MKKLFMCLFCLFLFISCGGNVEKLDKEIISSLNKAIKIESIKDKNNKKLSIENKNEVYFIEDYNNNKFTGEFWISYLDNTVHGIAKNGKINGKVEMYEKDKDELICKAITYMKDGKIEKNSFFYIENFRSYLEYKQLQKIIERKVIVEMDIINFELNQKEINMKIYSCDDNYRKIFEIKLIRDDEVQLKKFNEKGELFEKLSYDERGYLVITKYKNGKEIE